MINNKPFDHSFSIDTEQETKCVIDFIHNTWENTRLIPNFNEFVHDIFQQGIEDGKKWVRFNYDINFCEERLKYLESIGLGDYKDFDSAYKFLVFSRSNLYHIEQNAFKDFNFDDSVCALLNSLKSQYIIPSNLQPIGWDKFESGYENFDGMESFDNKACDDLFLGHNSEGVRGYPFHLRISLPHVMYDEKAQDRDRLYTLVGTIYSHALFCAEQNNSNEFAPPYGNFAEDLIKSEFSFKKFKLKSSNDFVAALYDKIAESTIPNKDDLEKKCNEVNKAVADWKAKSKEEQDAILSEKVQARKAELYKVF